MKRFVLIPAIAALLMVSSQPAQAQEQGVSVSPAIQIIQDTDLGKSFDISIKNNTSEELTFTPELSGVVRGESGTVPVDAAPDGIIDFDENAFVVPTGESYQFPVRVSLTPEVTDTFPAITFTAASGEDQVALNTSLVSVFLVQNIDGSLGVDSDITLNQPGIAFQPVFSLSGTVFNTGEKFYNPSGTIRVTKDGQTIIEEEITTQIEGLLFPTENKQFEVNWTLDGGFPDAVGNYDIELRVKPNPFEQTHISKTQVTFIPLELLVVGVPVVIVVLSVIGYLVMQKTRSKQS